MPPRSLVCHNGPCIAPEQRTNFYLFVSALNRSCWIIGSVAGAVAGTLTPFNSEGVDFSLTALFLTVFLEQWLTAKKHAPALIGVAVSVLCLLLFGSELFLIPAMLLTALLLYAYQHSLRNRMLYGTGAVGVLNAITEFNKPHQQLNVLPFLPMHDPNGHCRR